MVGTASTCPLFQEKEEVASQSNGWNRRGFVTSLMRSLELCLVDEGVEEGRRVTSWSWCVHCAACFSWSRGCRPRVLPEGSDVHVYPCSFVVACLRKALAVSCEAPGSRLMQT